jgi:hypothetical protein
VAAVEETDVSAIGGGGGDFFWCREGDRTANLTSYEWQEILLEEPSP